MKKNIFIALLLVCAISLTGCGKSKKNTIVGKWAYDSFVYTFNEDKTCSYNALGNLMKCTYTVDGDKLSILYTGDDLPFETTFKIDGNKLIIKDSFGSDVTYTRK